MPPHAGLARASRHRVASRPLFAEGQRPCGTKPPPEAPRLRCPTARTTAVSAFRAGLSCPRTTRRHGANLGIPPQAPCRLLPQNCHARVIFAHPDARCPVKEQRPPRTTQPEGEGPTTT